MCVPAPLMSKQIEVYQVSWPRGIQELIFLGAQNNKFVKVYYISFSIQEKQILNNVGPIKSLTAFISRREESKNNH